MRYYAWPGGGQARKVCSSLIFGILVYLVFTTQPGTVQAHTIRIGEGTLADWDDVVTRVADPAHDFPGSPGNHNDLRMVWVTHDSEFLYVRFDGKMVDKPMGIHLQSMDGPLLATAWVDTDLQLKISRNGSHKGEVVNNGLVEFIPASDEREHATVHAAWPLDQLGLTEEQNVVLWVESWASHPGSSVKDRVPESPMKLAYHIDSGTWLPHQPGATFQLNFVAEPSDVSVPQPITPGVVVQALDGTGKPLAIGGVLIELSLEVGTGSLSGSTQQFTDASGRATFDDLKFDTHGEKQLRASGSGLEPAMSTLFMVFAPNFSDSTLTVLGETGKPTHAVRRGETLTYVIDIPNTGNLPFEPIVTSQVPRGTTYVPGSAQVAVGDGEPQLIEHELPEHSPLAGEYQLPEIGPGQQGRITFSVIVAGANQQGTEIFATSVVSSGFHEIELFAVTTVDVPEIVVTTATDPTMVAPGELLTFTIIVSNESLVGARDVQVVSAIPPGMSYVAQSAFAPQGASIRFQDAKMGHWSESEPDEVAVVSWVLEVMEAESQQFVSLKLLTH